ncbi:undecaprenyldiphospho-muramoylpentapeptide beta-N-acetylglucosaminyltransferase [Caryophanon tenue]|uniref:UDP-N-acetylglucosamine--N-acetylmuramyl-(pentapeptide) pyrophosphoryl-undecaprenol N-acetylglucosamine transferase n=1 Tax=Caryophanon tenue TaxID=33978 RepID=A0A1C0YNQ3_9BACL|nr:undecaprenyldiphospho-muramoylpentapeptide beta-N-acetylglucosaminyltransferase [Caryophanon tenue]OCS88699.1 UDP-N-acetylglucosamine--N-acetylmuramyl-(pentapeptide) pyrophosphoryl-undecaprenol N-acetylglucosamine transferase [Caryophanon tenue]
MKNKSIVLTGGGTAGHVSLNQAIIPTLLKQGFDVHYVGSKAGIEKDLITQAFPNDVTYHAISSGKLRRYFSWQNFSDPFKVLAGVTQTMAILRKIKPVIVFSKGGFVSVPVVMAAKALGIPVVNHESDVTPGLANKLALPFVSHIFTVFNETLAHLPEHKATCTGSIIRSELFQGSRERGLARCGFDGTRQVVLIMGGSQGSAIVNNAVRENLHILTPQFDVIHLCGKGHIDEALTQTEGYTQFEYVTTELADLLYASDYVISRAGSNSIFEFLALYKPMMLIPLSAAKSRGDQILNARLFSKQGFAVVLEEESLTTETFAKTFEELLGRSGQILDAMANATPPKTPEEMVDLILSFQKQK